jgi:hypothetical protein
MTENDHDPVQRALEVFVFAPIGAGLVVKEMAPSVIEMLVARGRAEIDRRGSEIGTRVTTARSLGQVAVAFGVPMVRERVQTRVDDVLGRASRTTTAGGPSPAPEPVAEVAEPLPPPMTFNTRVHVAPDSVAPVPPVNGNAPVSADLPIPGYDALSASQVVERLSGLGRDELDAVHAYEAAHRQRRTILGKIEQLAG